MNVELLSTVYKVRKLLKEDIYSVLNLCLGNPIYYKYCPPTTTADRIIADMSALPPDKTYEDKYYIGFYQGKELIAVMDLISKFPDNDTAFIGFFMMCQKMQGKGIATAIISECCEYLKTIGFRRIRLGYVKGNLQSEAFWIKNHFVKTGIETQQESYVVTIMRREL